MTLETMITIHETAERLVINSGYSNCIQIAELPAATSVVAESYCFLTQILVIRSCQTEERIQSYCIDMYCILGVEERNGHHYSL